MGVTRIVLIAILTYFLTSAMFPLAPHSKETYKWIDKDGKIFYTNDLYQLPETVKECKDDEGETVFFDREFCPDGYTDKHGNNQLIVAVKSEQIKVVKSLLARGVNVNARNDSGETALMMASLKGNIEIIKVLLKAGADMNARDHESETALIYAVFFNSDPEGAKALIDAGADINAQNYEGNSALLLKSDG